MDPSTLESEARGGPHVDAAVVSAPQPPHPGADLSGGDPDAPPDAVEQAAAGPGTSSDGSLVAAAPAPADAADSGAAPAAASLVQAEVVHPSGAVATEPCVSAEDARVPAPGQAVAAASDVAPAPLNAGGAFAAEPTAVTVATDQPDGAAAGDAAQDAATGLADAEPFIAADFPAEPGAAADLSLRSEASPVQSEGAGDGGGWDPPVTRSPDDEFPGEVEMPLVDHLEELRRRVLRSLLAVVIAAAGCLLFVRPLVRLLEAPAHGIRFLQLAPGEFLFVSLKVAGYAGLTLAIPWILFEGLAFVLPGLTRRERRLVAPTVAGSTVLFAAGLAFAWWALVPAALRFLVSYGADVVEPIWSIERYLDFVLLLMVATALAFQLPVLQLLLGALGLVDARRMLGAWRWVVLISALAGAVLTPSTDPVTMLLLSGAITALYLIGVALVAVAAPRRRLGQA